MRVRAKEVCFVDERLRQAGEVFDYNGTVQYQWLEPIDPVDTVVDEPEQQTEPAAPTVAVKRGPGRPRKNPTAAT